MTETKVTNIDTSWYNTARLPMNTLTLPKWLGRLFRNLFHTDTLSASGDLEPSVDPYEQYKDRIPNRASRRALEELHRGDLKTYDSAEELFADLDDE